MAQYKYIFASLLFLCCTVQCKTIDCVNKCLENQFCNKTLGKCVACGPCFNTYNEMLRSEIKNFTTQTAKVVHKYELDSNELIKNITELDRIKQVSEKDLHNLNNQFNINQRSNEQITNKLEEVKNKIERLRDEISNYKVNGNTNQTGVIDKIKQEVNRIKSLLLLAKNITFDGDNLKEQVAKIKAHLGKIDEELTSMNLPNVSNVSLNVAFSVEHDLDIIELVANTYNSSSNVNDPSVDKLRMDVEKLLRIISDILNDYYEMSKLGKRINKLQQKSNKTWEDAKDQHSTLEGLLRKNASYFEFLEILQEEIEFFKKLKKLKKDYNTVANDFTAQDLEEFRKDVKQFENEYNEFKTNFYEILTAPIVNQDELEELLTNAIIAFEDDAITKNGENFTLGYFYDSIAKMTNEATEYENHFLNYCNNTSKQ